MDEKSYFYCRLLKQTLVMMVRGGGGSYLDMQGEGACADLDALWRDKKKDVVIEHIPK